MHGKEELGLPISTHHMWQGKVKNVEEKAIELLCV